MDPAEDNVRPIVLWVYDECEYLFLFRADYWFLHRQKRKFVFFVFFFHVCVCVCVMEGKLDKHAERPQY